MTTSQFRCFCWEQSRLQVVALAEAGVTDEELIGRLAVILSESYMDPGAAAAQLAEAVAEFRYSHPEADADCQTARAFAAEEALRVRAEQVNFLLGSRARPAAPSVMVTWPESETRVSQLASEAPASDADLFG